MAQHSVSAGWDRQERRHKYRPNASDLSLNHSGNPRKPYEDYRRDEEPLRRKGYVEARHSEPQQAINNVYEEDVNGGHHARPRKRPSKTSRSDGLDIDAGSFHSQETRHPRSSGSKMRPHSPAEIELVMPASPAHNPHGKVSPVRSPRLPTAAGHQQPLPSPPSPHAGRRRLSNKQYSSHSRHQESESQSSPKRPRLPTRRSPPPVVDDRRQIRRSPSKSPHLIPTAPVRHLSPPLLPSNKRRPSHNEQHSPVSRRQRSESPRSSKRETLLDRQISPSVREIVHKPDRSLSRSPPVGVSRSQVRAASPPPPPPSRVRSSHKNQPSPASRTRRPEVSPPPKQDHVHGRQRSSIIDEGHRNQRRSLSKSPGANVTVERRASSPVSPPPSRGRADLTRQLSPVSGTLQSLSPASPKRGRTPTQKLRPSLEGREQQRQRSRNHSPPPQWELPEEPSAGRRSPYEPLEAKRRSLTPARRQSPSPDQASQRLSPGENRRPRQSLTPLRRHVELGAQLNRASPPLGGDIRPRSTTPRIRGPSPRSGRKRSPLYSGERRRRDRSRTPVGYRERSRSRTPPARRKSPSPAPQSRRSKSPDSRRRSSRRSPQREQSPRRVSPRRRSSPGRYRSSRRDRRASPGGRRAWSPVQNRRNGIGKPGNNLFIAGFNFITTERDLEKKFSRYGRVMDVRIVRDKRSGESRGFGFLTLERDEDADAAIKSLDQTEWNGRIVLVEKAKTPTRF